jgi:hypothetical protein
MRIMGRAAAYGRAAGGIAAGMVLGVIWLALLWNFCAVMAPRFAGLAGPVLNTWPCDSPDCDFSIFWPAGVLARAGDFQTLYDPSLFAAWRAKFLFAQAQRLDWFYPPPALLPAAAISYLPFRAAFAAWTILQVIAAVLLLRWAKLPWGVVAAGLLSPAALWDMEMGQVEMLVGACVVAGLLMAKTAPRRAGALLAALMVKPQPGLLAPVALLARRGWRAIFAGVAVAAAVIGLETFCLGRAVWAAYLGGGLAVAGQTLDAAIPIGAERGVSVFWMLRSCGAGVGLARAAQALAALAAVLFTWRLWRRAEIGGLDRMAGAVLLSLLVTPYGYVDDMVAYSIALAALAQARGWRVDLADVLFFLWPAVCPVVFARTGLLLTPLVVAAAAARTLLRARLWPRAASVLTGAG